MLGRMAVIPVAMLFFTITAAESDAKVLARGQVVSKQPVTIVAIASAYKPSRVALDVVPHPSARVRVEWMTLCFDGPGPTTGGSLVTERPSHRRVKLPPRPRGLCHLDAEASFVDPAQTGFIAVTLRGRVAKPPISMP
jgi:hypothetical protein